MKKIIFCFLFSAAGCSFLSAQHEFDKWIFGKGVGLNFTGGGPTLISSSISGWDNCASISDSSGNLLFYSEGMHIYDRNGNLMPHGGGLLGDTTGGQPATIVRKPCSSHLYYLFTNDAFAWPNGFRYSVVDMNLNGGLGDIVTASENTLLLTPNTEGVTTITHANGNDVWILDHEMYTNVFHAYLLTATGLNTNYVASAIGSVHGNGNINDAIGELTRTSALDKVACAIFDQGKIEIFHFNNATGVLSDSISIPGYHTVIGLEFSPDGSKLYSTQLNEPDLTQFDLSDYNDAAIAASAKVVGTIPATDGVYNGGYMTLGPDQKIYVAITFSNIVGRINSPNSLGTACSYDGNAISLGSGFNDAGLVDKIAITSFRPPPIVANATAVCSGDSAKICASSGFTTYLWSNGGSGSCIEAIDTGTYYVNVTNSEGCTARSNNIVLTPQSTPINVISLPNTICAVGDSASICAPTGFVSFLWSNDSTSPCIEAKDTGIYYVVATDSNGCSRQSNTVALTLFQSTPLTITATSDTICPSDSTQICAPAGYASYSWNMNYGTSRCIEAQYAGDYYVSVTENGGCSAQSNHLGITVLPSPPVSISGNGDTLKVYYLTNVQWYYNGSAIPGATQNTYIAQSHGSYEVAVTDTNGCTTFSSPVVVSGVENIYDENISVIAYPNPFNNATHFVTSGINTQYNFELFDVTGRLTKKISSIEANTFELNRDNLPSGIYFYRISVAAKPCAVGKLVVE